MALYLGSLALRTTSGPLADIPVDTRPHKTSCDEFLGGSDARV